MCAQTGEGQGRGGVWVKVKLFKRHFAIVPWQWFFVDYNIISCATFLDVRILMIICNIPTWLFNIQSYDLLCRSELPYMLYALQPSFKAEFIDYKSVKLLMMSIWYLQGSKIRTLPPILTFSLLRFNYDFQRGERFKVTLI